MSAAVFSSGVRQEPLPADTPFVQTVIVGAGACGLTAALLLHDLGVQALVLERDAVPSGSTGLSSGFIPAAGTRLQRSLEIQDSAQQFAQDIIAKSMGTAAAHLVQAYTENIAWVMDALEHRHGLRWELLEGFTYPGHTRRRMHAVPERTGQALMQRLQRAVQDAEIDVVTSACVRQLWVDPYRRVTGVEIARPHGQSERLACQTVLLACNGFGGNRHLVEQWLPAMRDAPFAGHVGNDGSALLWGQALGAALADMSACQGHGSWATPYGVLISWALMMEGGIQVNVHGNRFHDETQGYSEASMQVLAQPEGQAWCVIDEHLMPLARSFADFRQAEEMGALRRGSSAGELAQLLGCSTVSLAQALQGVERSASTASPDTWGRRFSRPLVPPFTAIRVTGALFHTQGGLAVDGHCRVLTPGNEPLPNLWAAGGAARGVSGSQLRGYLSGNGLLSAVAGAGLAARSIAAHLKEPMALSSQHHVQEMLE